MIRASLLACSLLTLLACVPAQGGPSGSTEEEFISLCNYNVNPWVWPEAGPHTSPFNLPGTYTCTFYRDDDVGAAPHHWGSVQNPWSVEPCVTPVPEGKIALTWGGNTGGPTDTRCVMLTTTPDGLESDYDFHWMAALGWRTRYADGTEDYFRSFELGPNTTLMVSDLDRVYTSRMGNDWICQLNSHCKQYSAGIGGPVEVDHADSLPGGVRPWSFWMARGN